MHRCSNNYYYSRISQPVLRTELRCGFTKIAFAGCRASRSSATVFSASTTQFERHTKKFASSVTWPEVRWAASKADVVTQHISCVRSNRTGRWTLRAFSPSAQLTLEESRNCDKLFRMKPLYYCFEIILLLLHQLNVKKITLNNFLDTRVCAA